MTNRRLSHQKSSESGVTTVEGAVILVMFFMLIFGVIEAGRFLSMRQVLTNAAREGARFSIAPASGTNNLPTDAEVRTRVQTFCASASITCADGDITLADVNVVTGLVTTNYRKVTVQKTFQVIAFPGRFNALNIALKGESIMRKETSE